MKMLKIIIILAAAAALNGCASAPRLSLKAGAEKVKIIKGDPPDGASMISAVSVVDGQGCGHFGYRGTYERAVIILRNRAYQLGANIAQVMTITEPRLVGDCFRNGYKISSTLYRFDGKLNANEEESTASSNSDKLREVKKLFDEGILNEKEYKLQKNKILELGL